MSIDLLSTNTLSFTSPSTISSQSIRELADFYLRNLGEKFPDVPGFQQWIVDQYTQLPFRVEYVDYDPYRSLSGMCSDFNSSGLLYISTRNNEGILDPEVNLMFRAVHDYDHIRYGCDFEGAGELRACRMISNRCGDEVGRALLFSEIVGQACVALTKGDFAEQRFVSYPLGMRDLALRGA